MVTKPPYEITETGWGEFEIIIKIFFIDPNERPVSSFPSTNSNTQFYTSDYLDEITFYFRLAKMWWVLYTLLVFPGKELLSIKVVNFMLRLKKSQLNCFKPRLEKKH